MRHERYSHPRNQFILTVETKFLQSLIDARIAVELFRITGCNEELVNAVKNENTCQNYIEKARLFLLTRLWPQWVLRIYRDLVPSNCHLGHNLFHSRSGLHRTFHVRSVY